MNRRSFLKNSALALFGFTVLPPAETYQRIWKAQKTPMFPLDSWSVITYGRSDNRGTLLTQELLEKYRQLLWNTGRDRPVYWIDNYIHAKRQLADEPTLIP